MGGVVVVVGRDVNGGGDGTGGESESFSELWCWCPSDLSDSWVEEFEAWL